MTETQGIPRSSISRLRKVSYCQDQLRALEGLGYVSSWQHETHNTNHTFNIALASGGIFHRLSLERTRLLLSGLLTGVEGRETSAHLTRFDYGVLFTALDKELTLQQELGESYSDGIIESVQRLMGHFGNRDGFK
jgi:hypothetical protein